MSLLHLATSCLPILLPIIKLKCNLQTFEIVVDTYRYFVHLNIQKILDF